MEGAMQPDQSPTLYDRLGGVYNIATVVDDLIDRVMTDPRLNENPAVDEAHHRVSPAGFKFLVTEMVCGAAGGPQQYSGRPMGDSHRHLAITEDEWAAFMDDLHQAPGEVPGAGPGGTGSRGDRGEHAGGHRRHPAVADRPTEPVAVI
jgi:hemoglobin